MWRERMITTNDSGFAEDVLRADGPVLVRFSASWSNTCRELAPTVLDLAVQFAGKLTVVTIDVDENPGTASAYDVDGIPTLLLFRNGRPVDQKLGSLPKAKLARWLEEQLG
jgi:thioredoxin 1